VRRTKNVIIDIASLVCLSGCGRITACRDGNEYGLYPGVRYNLKIIEYEHSVFGTMAIVSMPFDAAADTFMLPRDILRDIDLTNELVVMEYRPEAASEEVERFLKTGSEMPEEIIELNEAKARGEYPKLVITKKRQYVIENWFSYVGNSVSVERGCHTAIKFTSKE
jgi:uncharacterized protein YceK